MIGTGSSVCISAASPLTSFTTGTETVDIKTNIPFVLVINGNEQKMAAGETKLAVQLVDLKDITKGQ
jgi:hypothetical protein